MSGFCGFVGKMDDNHIHSMIAAVKKDSKEAPIYFSDGYIHLGYVPYVENECSQIGHNENFTVWVMIDGGGCGRKLTPEVVIMAYEKKGISFLKELEGTFSIVLWDGVERRLYLIRDRYGAKPLFYAKTDTGLAFGTEIKALLAHNGMKKDINKAAIYQYMSFQSVYLPHTVFENVFHICPGCVGVYADRRMDEISYTELPFDEQTDDTFEEAADNIGQLLEDSVRMCTDDENLGIFLSGGLDSSLVAALAKQGKIKYSFCLKPLTKQGSIHRKEEDAFYSEKFSQEYGIKNYVWEMTPQDLIADADHIIKAFSQPFSGAVSAYFLAGKASGICKTVLTGDGADELFGSYRHHSVLPALEKYIACKRQGEDIFLRKKEFAPYEEMLPFLDSLYQYGGDNDTLWYYRMLQMNDEEKSIFLNRDMFGDFTDNRHTLNEIVKWDKALKSKGVLNRCLERDFYHLLPGCTMLYQDTLARNFGINLKMPFMDNKLTEYVMTLPAEYKIKEGMTKAVLRKTAGRYLPKEIIERRKEPFSLPIVEWLKDGLKEYLTDVLSADSVRQHGLLNEVCVQYALEEFYKHPNTKEYYGQLLWTMAMLERWAFLYM